MDPNDILKPGEKIKDNYGKEYTVREQDGTTVWVKGEQMPLHVTKVHRIMNANQDYQEVLRSMTDTDLRRELKRVRPEFLSLVEAEMKRRHMPTKKSFQNETGLTYGDKVQFTDPSKGKLEGFYRGPSSTSGKVKVKTQSGDMYHVPVALVQKITNGQYPDKAFEAPARVKAHRKFTPTDYSYFRGKGWTDAEILKKWDEEGGDPLDWKKRAWQNGKDKAEQAILNKMGAVGITNAAIREMSKTEILKRAKEGRWELVQDIDHKRNGDHVEVRLPSGKSQHIRIEGA